MMRARHMKRWSILPAPIGLQVDPATGRCPDNGASVDLASCQYSAGSGATELKTLWRDPDYASRIKALFTTCAC